MIGWGAVINKKEIEEGTEKRKHVVNGLDTDTI